MRFQKLDKSYKEDLLNIFRQVFKSDFRSEVDKFFYEHDSTWKYIYGALENEKLIATYISFEMEVQIRNKILSGHYLDGVATLPTYRNRGIIKQFFYEDVLRCKEENIPLILLDPFKHSYYRKFGFEIVMDKQRFKLDWDFISAECPCQDYSIKMGYLHANQELQDAYKEVKRWIWKNSPYNEMVLPASYEETKFHVKETLIAVAYDGANHPQGYILYNVKDESLNINILRYTNLTAFFALKKHLLSYKDQVNKLDFKKIPLDFPVELLIDTYWKVGRDVELLTFPSRMMRILDVKKLIEELIVTSPQTPICLLVRDEFLPECQGNYSISTDGRVEKVDQKIADLAIAISDLAPLLTGRKSARELYLHGKLEIPDQPIVYHTIEKIPEIVQKFARCFPKVLTFNAEEW